MVPMLRYLIELYVITYGIRKYTVNCISIILYAHTASIAIVYNFIRKAKYKKRALLE